MKPKQYILFLLLLLPLCGVWAQTPSRKTVEPLAGERIDQLLQRAGLSPDNKKLFIALNWKILTDDDMLMMGYAYQIPNKQDFANAQSIIDTQAEARKTYREAKKQNSSSQVSKPEPKKESPTNSTSPSKTTTVAKVVKPKYVIFPLLGKANERVDIVDSKLEGASYYLVSGHGGPDPGALATYNGKTISEDEYAYDVILRLARQLLSHRAQVHVIIQDPDDGIRDDAALPCDDHETCMGAPIPLDQIKRLQQRSDSINAIYAREAKGTYCRSVFIHVDSRSKEKRIDIFFYHFMKSIKGERLARTLRDKMEEKYKIHQPRRGFSGEVTERNLFVLRETDPAGVFIEIANIQNNMDLVRLVKATNREAMARWIAEGLIEDYKVSKSFKTKY